jgi:hypothetical protein
VADLHDPQVPRVVEGVCGDGHGGQGAEHERQVGEGRPGVPGDLQPEQDRGGRRRADGGHPQAEGTGLALAALPLDPVDLGADVALQQR